MSQISYQSVENQIRQLTGQHKENPMKRHPLFAIGAMSLFVGGCYTIGMNFDETKVDQIQIGETTRAQVVEMLGEPIQQTTFTKDVKGAVLRYTYTWGRGKATAFFRTSAKTKALVVHFDENDVTVEKAYTEGDF